MKEWIEKIDTSGILPRKRELIGNNEDCLKRRKYVH